MANELAIKTSTPIQPSAGASVPSNADAQSEGGGFSEALAEVLTAEATVTEGAASIAQQSLVKSEDLQSGEDLLDASVLFVDPQLLMQALAQTKSNEVAVKPSSDGSTSAITLQSNRAVLNAMSTGDVLPAGDQGALTSVLLDAGLKSTSGAGESSLDSKSEGKPGGDNAAAALLSNSAAAHERVAELHDRPVIRSHVGTSTWTEELAGKLTVMVGRGVQSASIQLSPENLGPLEIRISVKNEQASVWFGAAHAETRTALEQALPRLREMLASQGLNLSDAGVFREAPRQQGKQNPSAPFASRETEREFSVAAIGLRGIVDAYA